MLLSVRAHWDEGLAMPVPSGSSTLISLSSAVQTVSACKWLMKAHHSPCALLTSPATSVSWSAFLTSIAVQSVGMKVSHAIPLPSWSSTSSLLSSAVRKVSACQCLVVDEGNLPWSKLLAHGMLTVTSPAIGFIGMLGMTPR